MRSLERRYRRLLHAYPLGYRRARGAEIVGTYLDLAEPGRRWPSPADAADVVAGGVRERLRAAGAADLIPGVRLAATLAFTTATALAGIWTAAETIAGQVPRVVPTFGPFATTGIVVWAVWLLAAVVYSLAPLRWTRMAIGLALLLIVAALPVGALVGLPRPPLFVLVPHAVLGLLALAMPADPPRWQRLVPLVVAPLATLAAAHGMVERNTPYRSGEWGNFLPKAGVALLLTAMLTAAILALRHDTRGLWAVLTLLAPIGLLGLYPLSEITADLVGASYPDFQVATATAGVVVILTAVTLTAAVAARRGARPGRSATVTGAPMTGSCPTCGR
ncbi:hypothetical protein ACFYPX_09410 [Micromonospora zamorensis]|uniref:hypothetical protein n=1 Tax=Micromonospora zamorensis TaxID=709883 RepID=UPI0036A9721F